MYASEIVVYRDSTVPVPFLHHSLHAFLGCADEGAQLQARSAFGGAQGSAGNGGGSQSPAVARQHAGKWELYSTLKKHCSVVTVTIQVLYCSFSTVLKTAPKLLLRYRCHCLPSPLARLPSPGLP